MKQGLVIFTLLFLLSYHNLHAYEPIPKESGFSGFVNVGVNYQEAASNEIADPGLGGDISKKRISSLESSPESGSDLSPALNFDLRYTFAASRSQLFLGNSLEDVFRFDFATQLGYRKEIQSIGTLGISYLLPTLQTEVWSDPFVIDQDRIETDRSSSGVRITWEQIANSRFGIKLSSRKIEIDNERSGQFLGLSPEEQALLVREGDIQKTEILYHYQINRRHRIIPALIYDRNDYDGDAVKNDQISLQFSHAYFANRYILISNLFYGNADYKAVHPVYNKKRNDDMAGISISGIYRKPFGFDDWGAVLVLGLYKEKSNIDFYDADIRLIRLTALYRF